MGARKGSGWQDIVLGQVEVRSAETIGRGTSADARVTHPAFSIPAHALLRRAARARGLSVAAYIRRATMAFVAHDMGQPRADIFVLDARLTEYGSRRAITDDDPYDLDEERFGSWEVGS